MNAMKNNDRKKRTIWLTDDEWKTLQDMAEQYRIDDTRRANRGRVIQQLIARWLMPDGRKTIDRLFK